MKRTCLAFALTMVLLGFGCVIRTEHRIEAHIVLDIRHVEQEVQNVFDYVEGKTEQKPTLQETPPKPSASLLYRAIEFINPIGTVYAEEKTSAELDSAIANMKARNPEITAWKTRGCLGENNRGYVELRESKDLSDPEKKNQVQKLLADENKDRKTFYKEYARLRGITVSTMEAVGAKDKLKRAKSGEAVQLPAAGPDFDAFKASETGKKLGAACQPGEWVVLP